MNTKFFTPKMVGNAFISKILFVLFVSPLFVGCLSSSKIDKWVGEHYEKKGVQNVRNSKSLITVKTTDKISDGDEFSVTENNKSSVLPLPFYAQWSYSNLCTINEFVPLNIFSTNALSYANHLGLKNKLNGQTLELTVSNIPHFFSIVDKGWSVLPLLGKDDVSIDPTKKKMTVKYKVLQGKTVVKSGEIILPNADKEYHESGFQSSRKATDKYLDQYDASIVELSKNCVDKLLAKLQLEDPQSFTSK